MLMEEMQVNKLNVYKLRARKEVPKYTKEEKIDNESNVVHTQRKKLYDYYRCDYCKEEIRLDKKQYERSGGIVTFHKELTGCGNITMALCNKCLNKVIQELENRSGG